MITTQKQRDLENTIALVLSISEARYQYYQSIFNAIPKMPLFYHYMVNTMMKVELYKQNIDRIKNNTLTQDVIDDLYDICVRRHHTFASETETLLTFNEAPFLKEMFELLEPFVSPWKCAFVKEHEYSLVNTSGGYPELAWKVSANKLYFKYFSDANYQAILAVISKAREELKVPKDQDIIDQTIEHMALLSNLKRKKDSGDLKVYQGYREFYKEVVAVYDFFEDLKEKITPVEKPQSVSEPVSEPVSHEEVSSEVIKKKKKRKKTPDPSMPDETPETSAPPMLDQSPEAETSVKGLVFSMSAQLHIQERLPMAEPTSEQRKETWVEAFRRKRAEKRALEADRRQKLQEASAHQAELKQLDAVLRRTQDFETGLARLEGLNQTNLALIEKIFDESNKVSIDYKEIQGLFGENAYQLRGSLKMHTGSHSTIFLAPLPSRTTGTAMGCFDSPASPSQSSMERGVKGGTYRSHQPGHVGSMHASAISLIRGTLIRGGINAEVMRAYKENKAEDTSTRRKKNRK